MAGKMSKTNRTGRKLDVQRLHFCPTCDEPSKLFMVIPKRLMWGRCQNDHTHRKASLILK